MTDQKILALLSSVLTGETMDESLFRDTSSSEWKTILELSCPHGVAAVTYDALQSLPTELRPPKMLQISWLIEVEKAEKSYAKKCSIIARLSKLLASHDMEFVLLKGASTASYYPIPEHRYFGDVDFYVLSSATGAAGDTCAGAAGAVCVIASRAADRIISENFSLTTDTSHHHHNTYRFEGVLLENHYDFIEVHSHKSSIALENELKHLALETRGTLTTTGSVCISKAPATFNAVFLLRHMASHFAAGEIGLRHVLDYALFLEAEHSNIDYSRVRDILDRYHLTDFSAAINTIITRDLHLPAEYTTGVFAPQPLTDRVLHEVIHPAFPIYHAEKDGRTPLASIIFRTRRFFFNRWKHDLIYPENFWQTLIRSSYSHILKPKSLLK